MKSLLKTGLLTAFLLSSNLKSTGQIIGSWTGLVNVTVGGDGLRLTKTSGANTWGDAGAATKESLDANENGWIQTIANETHEARMIGLSTQNINASHQTIDYAIYLRHTGELQVFERSIRKFANSSFTYRKGDFLKIERLGSTIYYKKNGQTFYTSMTPSTSKLLVDVAMHGLNSTLDNISLSKSFLPNTDSETDGLWSLSDDDLYYNTGNVGIGTSSPTAGLEVKNDEGIKVQSSQNGGWIGSIKMTDGFSNTTSRDDMSFSTSGGFMFRMDNNGNGISNVQGFNVYDRNNNSVFTIRETNGNVAIQGKLEAKEIKVTLTPTADFVFEENYSLPTLDFIEKHINEKKHLPEIASAKEMKRNGVNIGEFQIQLLQKIEELTLYTIEQERKIEKIEKENESLKTINLKILELQKRLEKLEK